MKGHRCSEVLTVTGKAFRNIINGAKIALMTNMASLPRSFSIQSQII